MSQKLSMWVGVTGQVDVATQFEIAGLTAGQLA